MTSQPPSQAQARKKWLAERVAVTSCGAVWLMSRATFIEFLTEAANSESDSWNLCEYSEPVAGSSHDVTDLDAATARKLLAELAELAETGGGA